MTDDKITIGEVIADAAVTMVGVKIKKEDLHHVDAAFARYGAKRPSDDAGECSAALMKLLAS